jgi:hypothetical protein
MAPVPVPEAWNPIAPIQKNWDKIEPFHKGYGEVLGGLGTIFGAAAAIALIAEHGGFPKWPFTRARWNPKPKIDGAEDEVSEDQIVEDELAEIVGTLGKRSLDEDHLDWYDDDLLFESTSLAKRDGLNIKYTANIGTDEEDEKVADSIKHGIDVVEQEVGDIVDTAVGVGTEIIDDIKKIFGGDGGPKSNETENADTFAKGNASVETTARRLVVRFIS